MMTELLRALAALAEPPTDRSAPLAELVGLPRAPTQAEYTELFVFQQVPYASVYLGPDGMIGGEPSDRIAGFWRAVGITPPQEPDHLATMLAMYASLCDHAAVQSDSRPLQACIRAREAFLREHLLAWLPAYLQRARLHAPGVYRGWATMLLDVLREEAAAAGATDTLPLHLRDVPRVADPRQEGWQAFTNTLLSPARTGLILTWSDLEHAADLLQLGLRAGNRSLALRTLLEQDSAAVLTWIASEARTWHQLHEQFAAETGAAAAYWAGRARATASLAESLSQDFEAAETSGTQSS